MRLLESLDLSVNKLSGSIPGSITLLTSLDYLNLSYGNLSGRIPTGDQFRTLTNTSIYVGNRDLCGFPLPKCPGDEFLFQNALVTNPLSLLYHLQVGSEDEDSDSDMFGLFLSMGLGYAIGLWSICGILLFKISWRIAYVAKEILRRRILTS